MKLKKDNYLNTISIAGLSLAILSNGLNAQDIEDVGKFVGDFRARLEIADQDVRESSEAVTLRSRV
jgi:hypothetical protein